MRWLAIALALAGCERISVDEMRNTDGTPVEVAYLTLSPFCLFICVPTITTSGVDSDTRGGGNVTSGSNTTTQTVSPSVAGGS